MENSIVIGKLKCGTVSHSSVRDANVICSSLSLSAENFTIFQVRVSLFLLSFRFFGGLSKFEKKQSKLGGFCFCEGIDQFRLCIHMNLKQKKTYHKVSDLMNFGTDSSEHEARD